MKRTAVFLAMLAACSCGTAVKTLDSGRSASEEAYDTGYFTVEKDKNVHSIGHVEVDEKDLGGYDNIFDYLRGRVSGVLISGDTSAGGIPVITIRGVNSINASTQPLILVDGMETSDISYLNPREVASVDVLKDSAASLYGVRGACGVILIKTKGAEAASAAAAAAKKAAKEAKKEAKKAAREK